MKWLLLAVVIFIVATGRGRIAELFGAAKKLPKDFDAGKRRVDDPAMAAKDITPDELSAPEDSSRRF
jgi:hypothetical protein